ncbi:MAG: MFS transporter [Candidatus Eremiobacteraeota bacterium]|nr:MFS transporter [Candidatus Eremiobacteraeota bacterium]
MNQLRLAFSPRFAGLFWTQFLGALNDNLFKNALVILLTFRGLSLGRFNADQLVIFCSGLFILPFFLFSANAGQLADRYEKSSTIRRLKVMELVIAVIATIGLLTTRVELLLLVLFGFALQSAYFSPLKYGILPQLLRPSELVSGNALIETATSLAILFGLLLGGVLVWWSPVAVCVAVCVVAVLGFRSSRSIPRVAIGAPELEVDPFIWRPAFECLRLAFKRRSVFICILGISWFWLFAGSVLTLLPRYGKETLNANEHVVTFLLGVFSVGVAIGALLCERFSKGHINLWLAPVGGFGMSLFALDLWLTGSLAGPEVMHLGEFLHLTMGYRVQFDMIGLAVAAGLFIVPLFAHVQGRTDRAVRARVVAANNILNAFFMVLSAIALFFLERAGLSVCQTLGLLAALNLVVAGLAALLVPYLDTGASPPDGNSSTDGRGAGATA